jgi:glycine cleavage system H protein
MSNIPSELRYTKEHEWVKETQDGNFRIGITDFAQSALGDIVYIQLPKLGEVIVQGKVCGEVESTKSVSEIYAPITGKIVTVNTNLDTSPETLNTDPYGAGWIIEVEVSDKDQLHFLLSSSDYQSLIS